MSSNIAAKSESASQALAQRFSEVRALSDYLCEPLLTEDYVVMPTPHIGSPVKWHLAHTSWFFETLLLLPNVPDYQPFHPQYNLFFNSYYVQLGERQDRTKRGFLSRPTVAEIYEYRDQVTQEMFSFMEGMDEALWEKVAPLITIGLQHEQQHQEAMLTDIKHIFWNNPLRPVYREQEFQADAEVPPLRWQACRAGLYWIGHDGKGFAYDNESGRHQQFVGNFELASRLVSNGEFGEFIADGGYQKSEFWLDMGWDTIQDQGWKAPFYWEKRDDGWWEMTLSGMRPVHKAEPVCHLSYFEAEAYARWAGARLPTEAEWEIAAQALPIEGNFVGEGVYHPVPVRPNAKAGLQQMFGDVWEWTQSHYSAYPGYQAPPGALGEYNGKFMCNQFVLRGGSCVTSKTHIRPTYRNFFGPHVRWQFTGVRLARSS